MLTKSTILKFYKQQEIQNAIIEHAKNKEIGICFGEGYGKRPDILTYPQEIIDFAIKGATSFHCSEELWNNPMSLHTSASKEELNTLRSGWDLMLDIDCKIIEYSKICAHLIIQFLKYCGVENISCKYSGNKGFHIGVPFEAFPKQIGNVLTKDLFPEAPKKIANYIKENIKEALGKQILDFEENDFAKIKEKVNLPQEEIIRYEKNSLGDKVAKLNVDPFLEIDTILISPRHLYRMPYSLHEKSGLVSLPIDPEKVLEFRKEMANPQKIIAPTFNFLDRRVQSESARTLLLQALDFEVNTESETRIKNPKDYAEISIESPIKEEFFPPCMKLALNGLEDGKKRAIFCMINFLGKIGWNKTEIEQYLSQWNKEKNREPLREVYLKGQLHHFKPGEKLPPNCNNEAYYTGIGICKPDGLCRKIKNPVNYTLLKWKRHLQEKAEEETGRRKKKEISSVPVDRNNTSVQERQGTIQNNDPSN